MSDIGYEEIHKHKFNHSHMSAVSQIYRNQDYTLASRSYSSSSPQCSWYILNSASAQDAGPSGRWGFEAPAPWLRRSRHSASLCKLYRDISMTKGCVVRLRFFLRCLWTIEITATAGWSPLLGILSALLCRVYLTYTANTCSAFYNAFAKHLCQVYPWLGYIVWTKSSRKH